MDIYSGYGAIAGIYDRINAEVNYSKWADHIEECFARFLPEKPTLLLDLACGTGSMTLELASRGYDMIGVDGSEDMLSLAYSRAYEKGVEGILYLRQDMRAFELYGTVGAVTCCLDSINYLTSYCDIDACFACVHNYLDPDGLFIFDVNTPYKFENVYGNNSYILECEDEDGYSDFCAWQNIYDHDSQLCNFYLTVFSETEDKTYRREDEEQTERCYTQKELEYALAKNSFELLGIYGSTDFTEIKDTDERWYIVARAKKN